jgi:hypothetical protein
VTPFEWTRWRLQSAAASFLFILAAKTHHVWNSATTLGAELAFFDLSVRRASAQDLISLPSRQRTHQRINMQSP